MKIIGKTEYIDRISRPTDNVERDFSSLYYISAAGQEVRRRDGIAEMYRGHSLFCLSAIIFFLAPGNVTVVLQNVKNT